MRIAVYVVPVALAVYALFDLYRSEPGERAGLQPLLWVLIILLLPVLGPIVWIFVSTTRRMEARAAGRPSTAGPKRPAWPARRPGPVAPDDDPDFLRHLEQQWKRDGGDPGGAGGPGAPSGPDADPPRG